LLLDVVTHDARFLSLPIAVFFRFPFVVQLLALRQINTCLDQMPLPVQRGAYAGLTFLCHARIDLRKLFFVQQ
jgi:hypothetical protein